MDLKKGDQVKVQRGPLSGMTASLDRHDHANRAWHCTVDGEKVFVYDYELAETIERKKK